MARAEGPATARMHIVVGPVANQVARAETLLVGERAPDRLNRRDPGLWSVHVEQQGQIGRSLGWLDVAKPMRDLWADLVQFRQEVREAGYTHAVLLGMGGSSLISILWSEVFDRGPDGLTLEVLDSTDPEVIRSLTERLPLEHTVFMVASKSGTTTEPNAFHRYFWHVVESQGIDPAPHFVAITDPGTALAEEAMKQTWRKVFLNPSDIGGRYSALSLFGLVPAALYDLDGAAILDSALAMRKRLKDPKETNPGLKLGAFLGGSVQAHRDKVTLIFSPRLRPFAVWLEQLLAESTGKAGTGVVPVTEPSLGESAVYGEDRVFIQVRLRSEEAPSGWAALKSHPKAEVVLERLTDLGAEFLRWEAGTALAGRVLGIDPFDQPNVQESKDNTRDMLAHFENEGSLPEVPGATVVEIESPELPEALSRWEEGSSDGDYFAIMAYLPYSASTDEKLAALQAKIRAKTGRAVTVGYGPRFLHSTGQLHKGGPASGRYLQLTLDTSRVPAVPVPDSPYSFNVLIDAQARGDLSALVSRQRPVVTVNMGRDPDPGLDRLLALLD